MNRRIRLFLFAALSLVALLLPAVALAADGAPEVASGALQLAGVVSLLLSGAGIVVRLVKVTSPLHGWLPARWRWIPDAVLGAAGTLLSGLPMASGVVDVAMVVVSAAVLVAVAAGAGFRAPDAAEKPPETIHVVIPPIGIVFLVLLLASTGCAASLETARSVGSADRALGAPGATVERDGELCEKLDDRHTRWGAVAKGTAVLAGTSGLGGIVVETDDDQDDGVDGAALGLALGAVVAGSVSAGAVFVSERAATRWAAECSQ